jgi:hypothetical protein
MSSAHEKDITPAFDPETHLAVQELSPNLSMAELGYKDIGISPVALVHPFQLFSFEAIEIMRAEISKPQVTAGHRYASNIASAQLRGYARRHAPFTFAAWTNPKTVAIISGRAGIDLVPWSDYEVAHINLSVDTKDLRPVVGWHRDAYPFVCVLMLSRCTDMVGGETALRAACGNVIRVRAPSEGYAMILQGRYIEHQALPAVDDRERITAVTSFRPQSPFVRDDSMLRTVRPISNLEHLYSGFISYRLEMMERQMYRVRENMRHHQEAGRPFDLLRYKTFLQEWIDFLAHTNRELVPEDEVRKGFVEEQRF